IRLQKWNHHFLKFVNRADCVPPILNLAATIASVKATAGQLVDQATDVVSAMLGVELSTIGTIGLYRLLCEVVAKEERENFSTHNNGNDSIIGREWTPLSNRSFVTRLVATRKHDCPVSDCITAI